MRDDAAIEAEIRREVAGAAAIDVDSDRPAAFGERDRRLLEAAAALLAEHL